MEIGPVATWSWWVIVGSFGATAAWWMWADATGTPNKAVERMEKRKQDRINKNKGSPGHAPTQALLRLVASRPVVLGWPQLRFLAFALLGPWRMAQG